MPGPEVIKPFSFSAQLIMKFSLLINMDMAMIVGIFIFTCWHFHIYLQRNCQIFSANRYENDNDSWHFHIYLQRNFHTQLCLARKNLQLIVI